MNKFIFFLSGLDEPVTEKHSAWSNPLPVSRHDGVNPDKSPVTYGDYFTAAEFFLSENHFQRLISSIDEQSRMPIFQENIENVSIFLEKHGEFYHPSKIRVLTQNHHWEFVLNVAVSKAGLNCISSEFELLRKLRKELPWQFIPAVYEKGDVKPAGGKANFRMFLGQWFSGFNEFHIHSAGCEEAYCIEVWDQKQGNCFLSEKQGYELYRQTALIQTCYHNTGTFEQIHPWHHAAGDFVVKIENGRMQVKLITVRGYHALICNNANDLDSKLDALTFFLMDLSIKNRLDRFRGVGDIAWADDIYLLATIDGFFKGLQQKIQRNIISQQLVDDFVNHLNGMTPSQTDAFFGNIISAWPQQAPELPIIKDRIGAHAFFFEFFTKQFLAKHFAN